MSVGGEHHRGLAGDGSRQPDVDVLVDLLAVHVPRSQPQLQVADRREFGLASASSFVLLCLLLSHFIVDVQFVDLLHDLCHQQRY